jgi:hypothetical protein
VRDGRLDGGRRGRPGAQDPLNARGGPAAALLGPLAVVVDDALAPALDVYADVDTPAPFDACRPGLPWHGTTRS